MTDPPFRILSLDGGGSKGFYTLGVLREVEASAGRPLCEVFDLMFGTSTGSIIATLLALGRRVDDVRELYRDHVPKVMRASSRAGRSAALQNLANQVLGDAGFDAVRTRIGIVATNWHNERPMIFKSDPAQAHGRAASFVPGFGCTLAEAVQASCSAYPFFQMRTVTTSQGDEIPLIDGGYCANNPTLFAIADALEGLGKSRGSLRVLSVGVGRYPAPKPSWSSRVLRRLLSVRLLQKTLEVNTASMEQLCLLLYGDISMVRISDAFAKPELATDMFEHNLEKLNLLRQQGAASFAACEDAVVGLLED